LTAPKLWEITAEGLLIPEMVLEALLLFYMPLWSRWRRHQDREAQVQALAAETAPVCRISTGNSGC